MNSCDKVLTDNDDIISVIIPNYNGEKYLDSCLNSVINQKYKSIEIIIIDDGSTDSSLNIISKYVEIDSRIKVFSTENKGVSHARNIGIKKSSGNFITFLDSDDWIEPNMYYEMIIKISDAKADVCMCSYVKEIIDKGTIQNEDFLLANNEVFEKENIIENIIKNMIGPNEETNEPIMGAVWRCLFKNSILKRDNILFDESMQIGEDLLFCLESFVKCKRIVVINNKFYHYLITNLSSLHKYNKDMWRNQQVLYCKLNEYIEKNNIYDVDKRMFRRILKGGFDSINNICKSENRDNIRCKLNDISDILKNNMMVNSVEKSTSKELKYKILILNKPLLIYLILKFRYLLKNLIYKSLYNRKIGEKNDFCNNSNI